MKINNKEEKALITLGVMATFAFTVLCFNNFDIYLTLGTIKDYGVPGLLLCGVVAFCVSHVQFLIYQHRQYKDYAGPPRKSFLEGNYGELREAQAENKLFDLLRDWVIEYGDTIVFWRNASPKFFTTDPDIIRSMLTEITIFRKVDAIPNRTLFGQRITGTNSFLTVTDGSHWAMKRKVMSPYFTKIHLTDMFERCDDFIRRGLESQMSEIKMGETHVDLVWYYGELFQFFLGALGLDLDCEFVSKNAKFHNKAIQGLLSWIPQQFGGYTKLLQMRINPEVNEALTHLLKLRNVCQYILNEKMREYKKDGPKPDDIIHHVITANKKSASLTSTVSGEDRAMFMMDDVMTIFLVIDNMAKTLATLFVRIIRDERVYKKVCEEVRSVDMSSLQAMDKSLKYTEMVILEVLRLHPTLMRGIRETLKPTNLANGMHLPKKTLIFFGQLILHKHPKYWKDPLEFIPERWESGSKDITPFTYLPFVAGPRVCMGKHLAMMTMKMSIIHTLRNHDMRPVPGTEKEMDWDYRFTIVRPTKGHKVIISRVENTGEEGETTT